jgi:RNA-directed DNA polymerase
MQSRSVCGGTAGGLSTGFAPLRAVIRGFSRTGGCCIGRRLDGKSRMSGDAHVRFRERLGVRFPRATRLVICCQGTADEAMPVMRTMMKQLKLTVNEQKTRCCQVPEQSFDFLGYTTGRLNSPRTGNAYLGVRPSKKRVQRVCKAISAITSARWETKDRDDRVMQLNRLITGWANYFSLGSVSKAYRAVDRHACQRLRRWLRRKHKVEGRGCSHFPDELLWSQGLVYLQGRPRRVPRANA